VGYLFTLLQGLWRGIRSSICTDRSAQKEALSPLQRPSGIRTMRHLLKIALVASLGLTASICASPVVALVRANGQASLGTCAVAGQVDPGNGYWSAIWVYYDRRNSTATAGSYYYNSDVGVASRWTALNSSIISGCLGGGAVTNFIPDDTVLGGALASDAYMGFSFDYAGTHYEYAMVGATNTQWVANTRPADTLATEFSDKTAAIRQTLTDTAARGLTSALSANQAMVQDAKERFIALGVFVRSSVQPVVRYVYAKRRSDGSLTANPATLSSMGTFFGQSINGNGTIQLVFGSFDVQRDNTTGASTVTFNGKVAWERAVSDTTLLGYFIGGDLARSNIAGSFTGDQDHLGVTAGGYAVHEMAKQLYLDGFVSVGAGSNNLTMDDGVLALESDYATRSATFGMSISGVIGPQGYEIWPELALTVGRTWIDTVAFTGTAYGTTDDSLSLDAGMVTLANLTFRPRLSELCSRLGHVRRGQQIQQKMCSKKHLLSNVIKYLRAEKIITPAVGNSVVIQSCRFERSPV
jgi:hypothetical protein